MTESHIDTGVSPPPPAANVQQQELDPLPPTLAGALQVSSTMPLSQPPLATLPPSYTPSEVVGVEDQSLVWFCEPCLLGFRVQEKFDAHCKRHWLCSVPGCVFAALKPRFKIHVKSVHGLDPTVAAPKKQKQYRGPRVESSPCPSGSVAARYSVWFCESCLLGFRGLALFENHIVKHKQCIVPGCSLISIKRLIKAHVKTDHPREYAALLPTQQKNPTRSVSSVAAYLAAGRARGRAPGGFSSGSVDPAVLQSVLLKQSSMLPARASPYGGSSQQQAASDSSSSDDDSEPEVVVLETLSLSPPSPRSLDHDDSESSDSDDEGADNVDATLGNAKALTIDLLARVRDVGGDLNEAKAPVPAPSPTPSGKVWYCVACDEEIPGGIGSKAHMSRHVACVAPNCTFSASNDVVRQHFLKAHRQSGSKQEPQSRQARVDTGSDSRFWQRGCAPTERQPTAIVPPDTYCCQICRTPGHWIIDCPRYIKFGSSAERPALLRPSLMETTSSRPSLLFEETAPPAAPLTAPAPSAGTAAAEPNGETNSEPKASPWRCDACDKSFPLESQLAPHFTDHVPCPEAHYGLSAPKLLVTKHVKVVDDQIDDSDSVIRPAVSPRTAAPGPPSTYLCKICSSPGHWIYDCPKIADPSASSTSPPPAVPTSTQSPSNPNALPSGPPPKTYCCKMCQVPGHWIHDCPTIAKSMPTGTAKAQGDSAAPQVDAAQFHQKLPATYCCKTCGVPGHLIYNCPLKMKNYKATSSKKKQWRCDVCEIEVALESQLKAHVKQHVPCSEPGCKFAAAQRVVTKHARESHGHGHNLMAKENASSSKTSDASDEVVVKGRKYRLQEMVLDGVKCSVLMDVGEA